LDIILPELTALNQVEKLKVTHTKIIFITRWKLLIIFAPIQMMFGCAGLLYCTILEKHPRNVSIKKQGWTHGHEFLGGKMAKKIFERLHAVKPKDEIVQNGNDELPPYCLITRYGYR
jgi:tRNA nucleotidyltransferase (CCA-adding enzyme)